MVMVAMPTVTVRVSVRCMDGFRRSCRNRGVNRRARRRDGEVIVEMVCVTVHAVWMIRVRLDGAVTEIVVARMIMSMAMPMLLVMVMVMMMMFVAVAVAVRMRMVFMIVLMLAMSMIMRVAMRMIVPMMRMTKRQNANDIDEKAENAHSHELVKPLHVAPNG